MFRLDVIAHSCSKSIMLQQVISSMRFKKELFHVQGFCSVISEWGRVNLTLFCPKQYLAIAFSLVFIKSTAKRGRKVQKSSCLGSLVERGVLPLEAVSRLEAGGASKPPPPPPPQPTPPPASPQSLSKFEMYFFFLSKSPLWPTLILYLLTICSYASPPILFLVHKKKLKRFFI